MSAPYLFSDELNLPSFYAQTIQPFWQHDVTQGKFAGVHALSIAYAYVLHPAAIGSVVISSGRIESMIKYKELVYELYQNGYSVFIHDHRGQGLSGRMTSNGHMGYVACFADYVTDFKIFMEKVVSPNSVHKPKLLCHSMGGTIGALLVLDSAKLFSQVVFFAPMFGIRPALPGWFASLLLALDQGVLRLSGQSVGYFFGQKDYEDNDFTGNERTHSPSRYKVFRDEYNNNPQVQLGGVTGHWLSMAEQAMTNIENCAQAFPIPAIVFQATCDKIVDNTRQTKVARQMANTQLVKVTDAKHEILMEQDPYRQACLTQVLDFFGQT